MSLLVGVALATACAPAVDPAPPAPPGGSVGPGVESSYALRLLSTLPVRGHAPSTGYDRDLFGKSWTDDADVDGGHNGCDTRNDILRRDLTDVVTREGTRGCKVTSGVLFDEYTGETADFTSGKGTSPLVQIDHLVSLSNAWRTGGQHLDEATRTALANDPLNLQAVDGDVNQEKGSGDAATWLPPRRSYRCTYVARQVEVKANYALWVTPAERDAMARELHSCRPAVSSE